MASGTGVSRMPRLFSGKLPFHGEWNPNVEFSSSVQKQVFFSSGILFLILTCLIDEFAVQKPPVKISLDLLNDDFTIYLTDLLC